LLKSASVPNDLWYLLLMKLQLIANNL
jgi:hypothetical protein